MKKMTIDRVRAVTALALTQYNMRLHTLVCKMNISVDTLIRDCSTDNGIDNTKLIELIDMYYRDYMEGAE